MNKKVLFVLITLFSVLLTSCSFFLNGNGKVIINLPSQKSDTKNNRAAVEGTEYVFYLTFTDSKGSEITQSGKSGDEFSINLPAEEYTITGIGFISEYDEELTDKSSVSVIESALTVEKNYDYFKGTSEVKVIKSKETPALITLKHQLGEGALIIGKAIPEFSVVSSAKSVQPGEILNLSLTPATDNRFLKGTSFKWYINGQEIAGENKSSISISPEASNISAVQGKNIFNVEVRYGERLETKNTNILVYDSQPIYYNNSEWIDGDPGYTEYIWKYNYQTTDNSTITSEETQTLAAFCYDDYRNIYEVLVDNENYTVKKYTYQDDGRYSASPETLVENELPSHGTGGDKLFPNRIATDGNNIYFVMKSDSYLSTVYKMPGLDNKIYYINLANVEALNYITIDNIDKVSAISINNDKFYIAGITEGEINTDSFDEQTYGLHNDTYSVISYSINNGNIDFASKKLLYKYTDNDCLNTTKSVGYDMSKFASSSGLDGITVSMLSTVDNSITDLIAYNNNVFAIRSIKIKNQYKTSLGSGGTDRNFILGSIIAIKEATYEIYNFEPYVGKDNYFGTDLFIPVRIIAIKPEELFFSDGSIKNGDTKSIIKYKFSTKQTTMTETPGYRFDQIYGSSFEIELHPYKVTNEAEVEIN